MSQISKLAERMMRIAPSTYPNVAYHNAGHAQAVYTHAMELADRLEAHGISVNRELLGVAALWHDAGNGISPRLFMIKDGGGYRPAKHDEEVSGALMQQQWECLGGPPEWILPGVQAVHSTNPSIFPLNLEGMVLDAADLWATARQNADQFAADTRRLYVELGQKQGQQPPWPDFVRGSVNYLCGFTSREIKLTPDGYYLRERPASFWHTHTMGNILALVGSTWTGQVPVKAELGWGSPPPSAGHPLDSLRDALLVGIHPVGQLRRYLDQAAGHYQPGSPAPMRLGVPWETAAISLPDGAVDHLYLPGYDLYIPLQFGLPFAEFRRILKSGTGLVHVYSDTTDPLPWQTRDRTIGWLKEAGLTYAESARSEGYGHELLFTA